MVLSTAAIPWDLPWQDNSHFSTTVNLKSFSTPVNVKDKWSPVKVSTVFLISWTCCLCLIQLSVSLTQTLQKAVFAPPGLTHKGEKGVAVSNIQLVLGFFFSRWWLSPDVSCKENTLLSPRTSIQFAPNNTLFSSSIITWSLFFEQRVYYSFTMGKVVPAPIDIVNIDYDTMRMDYKESQGFFTFQCTFF